MDTVKWWGCGQCQLDSTDRCNHSRLNANIQLHTFNTSHTCLDGHVLQPALGDHPVLSQQEAVGADGEPRLLAAPREATATHLVEGHAPNLDNRLAATFVATAAVVATAAAATAAGLMLLWEVCRCGSVAVWGLGGHPAPKLDVIHKRLSTLALNFILLQITSLQPRPLSSTHTHPQ